MSIASFGVQKATFLASWSVLVDNYLAKKSDDKLDSLDKILMWMSQLVRMLRHRLTSQEATRERKIVMKNKLVTPSLDCLSKVRCSTMQSVMF